MLLLSLPFVQSKIGKIVTKRVNEDFGTNIVVNKIDLSFLGSVQLKGVEIRDHHQDTLIFVKSLRTSLSNVKKIVENKLDLGDVTLHGADIHIKTYKGEEDDSMNIFVNSFNDDKEEKSSTPFILKTANIYLDDTTFKMADENKSSDLQFAMYDAGGSVQNFALVGPDVSAQIRGLYFTENRGVHVTSLSSDFFYSKTKMTLDNTNLKTNNGSDINTNITFNYKREDFAKFTDKVKIKGEFQKSDISVKDLNKFYKELKGNDILNLSGNIKGTLNNFSANKVNLSSKNGLVIRGNMGFVNAFKTERGFVFDADINRLSSNYNQLKNILPNVLGKTLPTEFRRLGRFSLSGLIKVTPDQMDATLSLDSEIGGTVSDLQFTNIDNIDDAVYNGEIEFINFDIGKFANNDDLGEVSLRADVQGEGFKVDNINTIIIGNISTLVFKNYLYRDLSVNGQFQNKKFDGILQADDENFKVDFRGLADFSSAIHEFDFTADIEKLDLNKTNLFKRDSISELKGHINIDISGNTFDDLVGKATFKNLVYKNPKKEYTFKQFAVTSSVKDSIKTIEIDSKDIVKGKLQGNFMFKELIPVVQNALGSVYTNYEPIDVEQHQFVNFDFTIYNQIVDVFFPKVSIGNNTHIKGKVNADKNSVKLTFSSPKLNVYDNKIDNIVLRLDNKNKLYNTHLTVNDIKTNYYDVHKFNLLNRTVNDTLFFKSTFKGGKKQSETFNLDFYYTINEDKKSVVGIQKSTFNFNDSDWTINPFKDKEHKVTFALKDNDYQISPFQIISNEQKIKFSGRILGDDDKDIKASFENVQLKSMLPEIEHLKLEGVINGRTDILEKDGIIKPEANIVVNDLIVNDFSQGTLKMSIAGDNSFEKYKISASLRDYEFDNVNIDGDLDFSTDQPTIDATVKFKEYELNGFSDFGGDVISNLRGRLSGNFRVTGVLANPDFTGGLQLIDAGLTFPYLNIDFDLVENTDIILEGQQFIFRNTVLQDTKYETRGLLRGSIAHNEFKQWYLNLNINTDNLLVLDTKEVEDIPYYGTAFIRGGARVLGLTSNLSIDVNGRTEKGTKFIIPLDDVTTVNNYKLIRFKTNEQPTEDIHLEKVKGLNLKIDLEVTKEAEAQVVIDKNSGSDLIGSGTGNLDIEIDTRGKFNMFGQLNILKGFYNFKYGGIISKPFKVQRGGTISWSGDPLAAELDLTAIYETKANPAQLLENINSTRKIPIDLYTKITGGLFDSKQEFDIKIPNADSTIASELAFKLNDNDVNTKMQHFTFLLVFGTFYNEDAIGNSASVGATGAAAQVASNVLSSMINSEDGKIRFGVGYTQGDRTNVNQVNGIEDQVDVSLSTQISDRVLVNGKLGVPIGANNQSVVGEVKLEVLLNEEGTLRGTVFNKPNEVQYSLEEEGYTQGVGLSYQVNFNNLKELREKLGLKKKKKEKEEKKDSIIVNKRGLINFKKKKDTIKTKNEPNN